MSVQAVNVSFTWSITAPLSIFPSLPGPAKVGELVSHQFAASGGVPPYTWTATGLPPGVVMSSTGLLSGVPTAAGDYAVTITVTDSGA